MHSLVRLAVPMFSLLAVACGPGGGSEDGGSTSNVMPSECTLGAMVAENMVGGSKVGTASGSLTCPRSAQLDITVCLQSSMTMTFTDAMCATGSGTNTMISRSTEAAFAGTRNVRTVVRGKVNGIDLTEKISNVISIVR